jgi:MFS transporter, DHA1 family, inner membrane transport protein
VRNALKSEEQIEALRSRWRGIGHCNNARQVLPRLAPYGPHFTPHAYLVNLGISERALLVLLAAVQFTHILDFMVLMPMGPQLMRELHIEPSQMSGLVAAYAFAAGLVGLAAAPFMDRYDRRTVLLWSYAGFVGGTLACGLAQSASSLMQARITCGAFGGVSGSMVMSIVGDVVPPERRASGVAVIMTAFAVASAAGVPFGLLLAQTFYWEMPFLVIAGMGLVTWLCLWRFLPSLNKHMAAEGVSKWLAFRQLLKSGNAGWALLFGFTLALGHMVTIPLLSPFLVHNLGLPEAKLPFVYMTGGVLSLFSSPLVGRWSDRYGAQRVLGWMVIAAAGVVLLLTHRGVTPVPGILTMCGAFFVFAGGRFIPANAIASLSVPAEQRGAFMSLNNCVRDLASGLASILAGALAVKTPSLSLLHYDRIGYAAVAFSALAYLLATQVRKLDTAGAP